MTSRLKWVKAILGDVIRDGGNHSGGAAERGAKGFSHIKRLLQHNHAKGSSRSYNTVETRQAAPHAGAHKHLLNRSSLKVAVSSLINRVYQGTAINSYDYVDVLQGCSKQKDHELLMQVHDCIKKSGLEQNSHVANNLLKCYISCGRLQNARESFNKLLTKDVISWTIMIGGYAEHDQAEDAMEVYKQMRNEGGHPNVITYLSALKACAAPMALKWGTDIHAHIRRDGLEADVRVGTALVHMYAKCGSVTDARLVFDRMVLRDVTSWNAIIGGLAQHGHGPEAFSLFQQMQREGFTPNFVTYLCILSARADAEDLAWVKEIHTHASRSNCAHDLRVSNALIQMYAKCGSLEGAKFVFDSMMTRDVISWTAIIGALAQDGRGREAFDLFQQMQSEGIVPTAATYLKILNWNACEGALTWVKEVHSHAASSGLVNDVRVGNALIHMYSKSGSIEDARGVFDGMEKRDVITWNAVIGELAQHGQGHEAFALFQQMEREGFTPNSITYLRILSADVDPNDLSWVKGVHGHAVSSGLNADLRVGNALVHMYAKSGSIEDARVLFNGMLEHDVISWNTIIGGLAQEGHGLEAFSLFQQMQREGFSPNSVTYLCILSARADSKDLPWVKEVHSQAIESGLAQDLRLNTALIHMYSSCGSMDDAKLVFDTMMNRDVVSWNAMIAGLARYGRGYEAFSCFQLMHREGVVPNAATYLSILNSNACEGALAWVKEVYNYASRSGVNGDLRVGSALVNMFAKSGSIEGARSVFDGMERRDVIAWSAMIGGLAQHGQGREALQLFEIMKLEGVKPTGLLFVAVLSACNHAGLVDEGRFRFASMTRDHDIEPALEHYTCVVDLLGREGHLEEAKLLILNMPMKPDIAIWCALLGACKTYVNLELAELAAKECMKLEATDSVGDSSYVLRSNLDASVGDWDQVSSIRRVMKERGIRRDPGPVLDGN